MNEDTQGEGNSQDANYDNTGKQVDPAQELALLKTRATLLGVEFSNNIGLDTLKARVQAKMEESENAEGSGDVEQSPPPVQAEKVAAPVEKPKRAKSLRQHLAEENMKLLRVRITCMNPGKANVPGEVFTVANEYVGTVKKFIPFGEKTEGGYHIPYILYKMLKTKKFLNIRTTRDRRTGIDVVESNYQNEFAIEILPALTAEEIDKLAIAQTNADN